MSSQATVAAISTPLAAGGIGIIRISGENARKIAALVFAPSGGKNVENMAGYTVLHGKVFDAVGDIDEALATVFIAPKSYTGEDVVELSCHGGIYLLQRVLRAVFAAGAVPAQAGEFTKRAFLNGKLGLTQAEAVMNLISAQGAEAARTALAVRDGALYTKIKNILAGLLAVAAHLSAWVDYPDDEIPEITNDEVKAATITAEKALAELLAGYDAGRVLREGVETAIVGKPNVGKSTLMNLLSGFERSIVTEIAGTTRDIVEDTVKVGDVILHLADTAGLRETGDAIEQIGVGLARKRLMQAGLVLAVFDSSDELSDEDIELIKALKNRPAIAVINKSDLDKKINDKFIKDNIIQIVYISAKNGQGAEELAAKITEVLGLANLDSSALLISNERQRGCAMRAKAAVEEAQAALAGGMTLDAVNVCIDDAIAALLELTGERVSDAVVAEVFASFCVGK
ncbi:MAG: tRNA uridine-5-carboxymethylaminomethyl(34) synthesis GTPase MnmE [Hydrogenoanaerobacterium sp.]